MKIIGQRGHMAAGNSIKAAGFMVIAAGGAYASLTRDFRIGSLVIAVGALIIAAGEFFP